MRAPPLSLLPPGGGASSSSSKADPVARSPISELASLLTRRHRRHTPSGCDEGDEASSAPPTATPTSVLDLPPELLAAICHACMHDCRTVVWLRLVCRRWRDVIDTSLGLQYRIGLVRDGMVDQRPLRALSHKRRDEYLVPTDAQIQTQAQAQARVQAQNEIQSHVKTETRTELRVPAPAPFQSQAQVRTRALSRLPSESELESEWASDVDVNAEADAEAEAAVAQLTLGDRLERLRKLRQAWKTLDWTRCVSVPISGPCCAYELVGGIFCKTQPRPRPQRAGPVNTEEWWLGDDDGMGEDGFWHDDEHGQLGHGHENDNHGEGNGEGERRGGGSRTLSATWLPGSYSDGGRTFEREDLGIPTRDFAMDPSQDLMVLFKSGETGLPMAVSLHDAMELHVHTISTNEAHPQAKVPVLSTSVLYPVTSVCVQIVDDVVGMMYCVDPSRPRITIWNWKTGDLVVDCSSGLLPPGTWDFSFINSRALFVTTGNGSGSLELFTFTCDRTGADSDANADDGAEANTPTQAHPEPGLTHPSSPLTHVASLQLPPVQPSVRVLNVGTHTGPFVAGCSPDKPFVTSNEERIHVLTVQYVHLPTSDGPVTRPRVCAFLHNRMLEGYLEREMSTSPGADPTTTATVVPWSKWGRKCARMLPHVGMFQWLRYIHGQRVAMLLPGSEQGKSTFQVLDFNPYSVFDADDGADLSVRKTVVERVHSSTRIEMPHIFVDVVETALPYRAVRREVEGHYSGVMIDDERLIGLKFPAFSSGDMKEIDVFTM